MSLQMLCEITWGNGQKLKSTIYYIIVKHNINIVRIDAIYPLLLFVSDKLYCVLTPWDKPESLAPQLDYA